MSCERLIDNSLENSSSTVNLNFITNPQFMALKKRFGNVLENMKDNEALRRTRIEFSKLLQAFETCYLENERKTHKIYELMAVNTIRVSKVKCRKSEEEETVKDLRKNILYLQEELCKSIKQRDVLSKEVEDLKKTAERDMKNKITYNEAEPSETVPQGESEESFELNSKFRTDYDSNVVGHESKKIDHLKRKMSESNLKEEKDTDVTDIKALRNNLEVLVADLKLSREKILELKEEVLKKDTLVKDFCEDLNTSEMKLIETQAKLLETKKPMEAKLEKYRTELKGKKQQIDDITKQLEKELAVNAKLTKDISSEDAIIEDMKSKICALELARESAFRKANIFEEHLVKSERCVEVLKHEIAALKEGAVITKREIPTEVLPKILNTDKAKLVEISAQERTIESLKRRIASRDDRLCQVGEELKSTVAVLQSVKKDFKSVKKEKIALETEIQDMWRRLKERTADVKQLKEQLVENESELEKMKREFESRKKKHQQVVDKKNKFHNMCNQLKMSKIQQEKENKILVKREQYLVKMLKEKDMEIERVVAWKRYIN